MILTKSTFLKTFFCFILSALLLTSCGAEEDKSEAKENVSSGQASEDVSAESEASAEESSENGSTKEESGDDSGEDSTESIDNEESGELAFYPPEGAEIVYGEDEVPVYIADAYLYGLSVSRFLEEAANEEAYYYVCIDIRNTNYDSFENQNCEGYSCVELVQKELEKYFTNPKKFSGALYTAYVTKEQIATLKKGFSEDLTTKKLSLRLYCVPENFVEEWIEYENTHGIYNGLVEFSLSNG